MTTTGQDRTVKISVVIITVIVCSAALYWIGSKIQDRQKAQREDREASQAIVQKTATVAYENWIVAAQNRWMRRLEAARSQAEKEATGRDEGEELKQIRAAFSARGQTEEDLRKFIELADAGYTRDNNDK